MIDRVERPAEAEVPRAPLFDRPSPACDERRNLTPPHVDEPALRPWTASAVFTKGNRVDIATGYIIDGRTGRPKGMIPIEMFGATV